MSIELVLPQQRAVHEFWQQKLHGRRMPHPDDVDLSQVETSLLNNICVIDVIHEPRRYKIVFAGNSLFDVYGIDVTGSFLDELDFGDAREYWLSHYDNFVAEAEPRVGVIPITRVGKEFIVQHWMKLPLSLDDRRVDRILALDLFLTRTDLQKSGLV